MTKHAIDDLQEKYNARLAERGVSAMQIAATILDRLAARGYPLGGIVTPPYDLVQQVTREVVTELCGEDFDMTGSGQ